MVGAGPAAPPAIPPDYYWRYLRTVLDVVLEGHPHLFVEDEVACIRRLRALGQGAQQLFARLLGRKGELFRRSKVVYPEIGDLDGPIAELVEGGFLEVDPPELLTQPEVLAWLRVPELKGLAGDLDLTVRGRKEQLVERIAELPADRWGPGLRSLDQFLLLTRYEPFLLAQVVFYGNRHQDQTAFVLVDLEVTAFEPYAVDRAAPLFPDREALVEYLAAAARRDEGWLAWEEGEHETLWALADEALQARRDRPPMPPHRRRVDPARYDDKLVLLASRELERQDRLEEAVERYVELLARPRNAGLAAEAADRLGLGLKRLDRAEELPGAVHGLLTSGLLDDLSRFRVERRLALAGQGRDPREALLPPPVVDFSFEGAGHAGGKAAYLVDDEAVTVEQAVLHALGGDGLWCENGLYTSLFGLLAWEALFAPVPGVFQHPFQDAPLDLGSDTFHEVRRSWFDPLFEALESDDVVAAVTRGFDAHEGVSCRGVAWSLYDRETLARAAGALGPQLIPILRRIARHPRRHRRGMPDLFVFGDDGPLLVEVKGPGDQVSVEQSLWHDALLRAGVDVRLARVRRT